MSYRSHFATCLRAMIAAYALIAFEGVPTSAGASPIFVVGNWRVIRVQVVSKNPVQAPIENDPSYMGAIITFSPSAIKWHTAKTDKHGNYSDCAMPRFASAGTRSFSHHVLVLDWYDNGVLTLSRVAR